MSADVDPYAEWDASFVLGSLTSAERREYEQHLLGCVSCRTAVAELAGLPPLLAQVPIAHVVDGSAAVPVPDTLLPRLVRDVRRRTRRTRIAVGAAFAAAAAALVLVVVVRETPAPTAVAPAVVAGPAQPLQRVVPSQLDAGVRLVAEPWGTRIELTCTYAGKGEPRDDPGGPPVPREYVMVVTDTAAVPTQVATWTAGEGSTVEPTASTSLTEAQIASVEVRSTSGDVLLRLAR